MTACTDHRPVQAVDGRDSEGQQGVPKVGTAMMILGTQRRVGPDERSER